MASRLFFALWPDEDVVRELTQWARQAHDLCGGCMMHPDTLHLTLAFLGSVDDDRVPGLQALLRSRRWIGGPLTLDCYGRFRGPRIVWAGSSEFVPWLDRMHAALWRALSRLGFEASAEPFRPHLSLLRRADPQDLSVLPTPRPVVWAARRLVLVASTPRESGSWYREIAACDLSAADGFG
ncbi:MAG: RNA 2',3'-cyclic phosphodiesterase [Castellaniella sp.]|uniref:RNA 2',3'-cyclic phosphodiesterase n=1 Tax=Castellaniella sp. TaxID=1955812 RepID=UPI00122B53E3|nr:RNA 2',3'-cyclic phosphodiesterase [Castellaniella sp.]TAN27163.1 MAG: RNA 2',3'-cyclic phosphodiesterase [Castellaniella sp.]